MYSYSIAQLPHFPKKNFIFFTIFLFFGKMTGLQLNYSFDILLKNDKKLLTNITKGVY